MRPAGAGNGGADFFALCRYSVIVVETSGAAGDAVKIILKGLQLGAED
ncbi:MAG: hypothetical protein GF344_11630 [Chitinivibrionales bacterium]|nr:hypothetical protein [Chitinivibrionales bacterium]